MTADKEAPAATMYKSKSSGAPSDGQAREKWVNHTWFLFPMGFKM